MDSRSLSTGESAARERLTISASGKYSRGETYLWLQAMGRGEALRRLKYHKAETMDPNWNDNQPIYRQLRDKVVAMILEEVLKDGDALPSVRNVAAEYRLNPLTVLKGYQELVDENLVEKKRGLGMFVMSGAKDRLLKDERKRFLKEEWPLVLASIQRLGLDREVLFDGGAATATDADGQAGEKSK